MTKQVQFRRGTTAEHSTFTGALAEITVNTDKKIAVVHDGSTVGGHELVGRTATQTLTNKTLSNATFTDNVNLGDNVNLNIGTSSDLVLYHNGSHSYIQDVGTGNLYITTNGGEINLSKGTAAENMARFIPDGAVELYWDNSKKLETTTSGVTVTGTLLSTALSTGASGTGININGTGTITGPSTITIDPAAIGDDTGTVEIKGNLTVQGTTTTINSTTSVIADPVIELRKGNSITASDGGIQVNLTTDGSGIVTGYQRIQWNNTNTRWETTDGTTAKPIVNTVDAQTIAGNKTFSNNLTASGTNAAIQFSPTGTGSVTINPATTGTINNMSIGATTRSSGAFTTLDANSTVGLSPANASVTVSPTGTGSVTINPATAGNINNMNIGATTKGTGAFSSLAVKDTSANFDVTFTPSSSTALTANRALTFDVVNAARTIKLSGNIDVANNFTTSGNFALILTTTAATNVTLPTSGTLATLSNTTFVGTTSIALNRTSAEQSLTGITGFSTTATTGSNSSGISIITGATTTSGNSGDVTIDVGAAATTLGVVNIATTNATTVNVGSTAKNTTLSVRGNGASGTATLDSNVTTGIINLFTGVTGTINIGTTGTAIVVPEPATASSAATKGYVDAMAIAMGL